MNLPNAKVLTTEWLLENSDIAIVEQITGADVITSKTIEISKGYGNQRLWTISVDHKQWVKNLLTTQKFDAIEMAQLKSANTVEQVKEKLKNLNELTPKQQDLSKYLQDTFGNKSALNTIHRS